MERDVLTTLNRERAARRAAILVSDFENGISTLYREADTREGALGAALSSAFDSGKSGMVEIDGQKLFFNVHLPSARLVIIGAVHISQALAPMARIAGFDVEIVDPRSAFATPERFPDTVVTAEWPDKVLTERPLDAFTALVAVTHDPKIDDGPIEAALRAGAFYVGALGSRKTHSKRVDRLRASGLSDGEIARIRAPIGLSIGAASPAEIAVAVLAEVIQSLRSRGREQAERAA
ncbi:XdhC family protein [Aliihoeflea aestuarii]|uniref:XdhC family protein n=1 Tax=Aliihoeflea aestuarii TaxID=453840 RepID=UPI0020924923|nr:XdhC family protein [Aliihoeflea aestuarii]MCO6390507.1 XdhC family protein [Aliihoeflea aestuarii]